MYIAQKLRSDNTGIIIDNPLTTFTGPVVLQDTISGAAIGALINDMIITQTDNNLVLAGTLVPVYLTPGNYATTLTNWHLSQQVTVDNSVILGCTLFKFPQKGKVFLNWKILYTMAFNFPQQYTTFIRYHANGTATVTDNRRYDNLRLIAGASTDGEIGGTFCQQVDANSALSFAMLNTENNNSVFRLEIIFILDS